MPNKEGPLRRVFRSVTSRLRPHHDDEPQPQPVPREEQPPRAARTAEPQRARPVRREPDIPLDRVERAYMPMQTSLKAPFRADGRDRQSDQELTPGDRSDRWNDEDRFTNKSGDPRIGTHGRAYEPGEKRQ